MQPVTRPCPICRPGECPDHADALGRYASSFRGWLDREHPHIGQRVDAVLRDADVMDGNHLWEAPALLAVLEPLERGAAALTAEAYAIWLRREA